MKKYNSMLAVLCFIGFIGYELSRLPISFLASQYLGSDALATYSAGNSIINITTLLIAVIALIAIFKPNQVLTIIACVIELIIALLCIIAPNFLIKVFFYDGSMINMGKVFLKMCGIIMLVVTAVSIPIRFIMNQVNFRLYLIITIAGAVLSAILPWIFTIGLGMGVQGMAFSTVMQPLACLVPLILLNSENNIVTEKASATVSTQSVSQHSYLDEYKKRMKGE